MIKDIRPQWENLYKWFEGHEHRSPPLVFEMIEKEYQAFLVGLIGRSPNREMLVDFPSEKSYSLFLLKWS